MRLDALGEGFSIAVNSSNRDQIGRDAVSEAVCDAVAKIEGNWHSSLVSLKLIVAHFNHFLVQMGLHYTIGSLNVPVNDYQLSAHVGQSSELYLEQVGTASRKDNIMIELEEWALRELAILDLGTWHVWKLTALESVNLTTSELRLWLR